MRLPCLNKTYIYYDDDADLQMDKFPDEMPVVDEGEQATTYSSDLEATSLKNNKNKYMIFTKT